VTSDQDIATTWLALQEHVRQNDGSATNSFLYSFGKLDGEPAIGGAAPQYLWAASEALTRGALLHRTDTTSALLAMVQPRVGDVATATQDAGAKPVQAFLGALAIHDLAKGGLTDGASDESPVIIEQLTKMAAMPPFARRPSTWALLAHGLAAAAKPFLPFDPGPKAAQDVEFGAYDEDLLVQFYRCIRDDVGAEVARPMWEAWKALFPSILASENSSWPEFLWSARAFHTVICKQPESDLIGWLREDIA